MSLNELPLPLILLLFFLLSCFYFFAKRKKRQQEIGELYSPAYGLLLSKRSKKIEAEEFRYLFRDLLIKKSHLASDIQIRLEMKEWLRNNRDPEGYRLQMLIEDFLDNYYDSCSRKRTK
ncbi:MAG TPA: hypothetical protein VJ824_03330 [Bacillota bacterium]|nr:hypothetical protein [Bacillota bacterium]